MCVCVCVCADGGTVSSTHLCVLQQLVLGTDGEEGGPEQSVGPGGEHTQRGAVNALRGGDGQRTVTTGRKSAVTGTPTPITHLSHTPAV